MENADVADNAYTDGVITDTATTMLADLKARQPFFLGVGYNRPHLPFTAPKRYWDLYDATDLDIPTNHNLPIDAYRLAYKGTGEIYTFYGMPQYPEPLSAEQVATLIHGYYASVSYIDAQVGRLLDALEAEGLADNTIVVLWGDHGFHLGDHNQWGKVTNFENATRIPLLIKVPDMLENQQIDALVETIDIYPTLVELCDLPMPTHLEGSSMVSLLNNANAPWKDSAFSQIQRRGYIMGYSMRTDRYRYNEWRDRDTGINLFTELYDMQADPNQDVNVAAQPAYANAVASLSQKFNEIIDTWSPRFPALSIETLNNDRQADAANDYDVPRIAPSGTLTRTYKVTNTGTVDLSQADIQVSDTQPGVTPRLDTASDDGDGILSPNETWTYTATTSALNLSTAPPGVRVVPGCNDDRNTLVATGRVDLAVTAGTEVYAEDESHYCNMGDVDNDGITDSADNCLLIANAQQDSDGDGYGNRCDADINNDCFVNGMDLGLFEQAFGTTDPDADLNGNGFVNARDLGMLESLFGAPPGPSGTTPLCQ
jgi:hypothetical protein